MVEPGVAEAAAGAPDGSSSPGAAPITAAGCLLLPLVVILVAGSGYGLVTAVVDPRGAADKLVIVACVAFGAAAGVGFLRLVRWFADRDGAGIRRARPPSTLHALAVLAVCVDGAITMTTFNAGPDVVLWPVALLLLGAAWLSHLLASRAHRTLRRTPGQIARWSVAPLTVIALVAFLLSDTSTHLRFRMSEEALTRDARARIAAVDATGIGVDVDRWAPSEDDVEIGRLRFDQVHVGPACRQELCDPDRPHPAVSYLIIASFGTYQYIYSPEVPPNDMGSLDDLGGGWWYYEQHF